MQGTGKETQWKTINYRLLCYSMMKSCFPLCRKPGTLKTSSRTHGLFRPAASVLVYGLWRRLITTVVSIWWVSKGDENLYVCVCSEEDRQHGIGPGSLSDCWFFSFHTVAFGTVNEGSKLCWRNIKGSIFWGRTAVNVREPYYCWFLLPLGLISDYSSKIKLLH